MTGTCAGCGAPAERELLTIPGREPFNPPVLSCLHGARVYGLHNTRTLRAVADGSSIPPAQSAAGADMGPVPAVDDWSEAELREAWGR